MQPNMVKVKMQFGKFEGRNIKQCVYIYIHTHTHTHTNTHTLSMGKTCFTPGLRSLRLSHKSNTKFPLKTIFPGG
jgi:hypothetical protein